MRRLRSALLSPFVFTLAVVYSCQTSPLQAQPGGPGLERAKRLVVMIDTRFSSREEAIANFGAGVVVGVSRGRIYIVTANHVLRRGNTVADEVRVRFHDLPSDEFAARVLDFYDPIMDYGVVMVSDGQANSIVSGIPFQAIRSTALSDGLAVFHVGQPNELEWSTNVTPAAIARFTGSTLSFQSPSLTVGYSGGGLFDNEGNLVGIVTRDASTDVDAARIDHVLATLRNAGIPISLDQAPPSPAVTSEIDTPEQGPTAEPPYVTEDERCRLGEPAESLRRELRIPRYVEYLYVFLQTPGPVETAVSEWLAAGMEKEEFIKCFEAFREIARARGMRLIITATDSSHQNWYQPQIRFRGQNLRVVRYKFPNEQRTEPGAEVPLN